jgi:hypothetical protein
MIQRRYLKLKRYITVILVLILIITSPIRNTTIQAETASKYIKITEFAKELLSELGLQPSVSEDGIDGHIIQLNNIGVIKDGDFKSYTGYLTRGDLLILLNRADKYLNKIEISEKLIKKIIDMRISDIKSVKKAKRTDISEGFARGFLKGFSNGEYSADRNLKLTSKVTREAALNCIKMLKDTSLRIKLSPDGQLLRTTKLPNNAYMFPYILASYPNYYYESQLAFEGVERRRNGKLVPLISPEDFTYPKDVALAKYGDIEDFEAAREQYYDIWEDKVRTVVWNTFNVDYRTIDDTWVETMARVDAQYDYHEVSREYIYSMLNQYVEEMKLNKTIVECDKVAMDSSSMCFHNGGYYIRCYVHYRIVSTNTKTYYSPEELDGSLWGPYNCVLYSRTSYTNIENYKLGKWTDGIFDVRISTPFGYNEAEKLSVAYTNWSPALYRVLERK